MRLKLDRRTVLRGVGATVGLPLLECMLNGNGTAYAQSGAPLPRRYAIVFAGQALGGDGWANDQQRVAGKTYTESGHFIAPVTTGRGYALTTPLSPLASLADQFSIVSGMRIPYSTTS